MAITINDGMTVISLPSALQWVDEYEYDNVKQDVQSMLGGGIVVSENLVTAGRPITLESGDNVWITKSVLDSIVLMRSAANVVITLTLNDGRAFNVTYDRSENIEALPVWRKNTQLGGDFFTLKIKFMEI